MSPTFFWGDFYIISILTMVIVIIWYACYSSIVAPTLLDWKYTFITHVSMNSAKQKHKIHPQQKTHLFKQKILEYFIENKRHVQYLVQNKMRYFLENKKQYLVQNTM